MVVTALFAKPLSASKLLNRAGLESVDYFMFFKHSNLRIKVPSYPVFEDFVKDFAAHEEAYRGIQARMADRESQLTFAAIVNFRLSSDLRYMENFVDRKDKQYFEPFLRLQPDGEVFVVVGVFDGFTTAEFIKRCPGYRAVHFFEPDEQNMIVAKRKLAPHAGIHFHQMGLSDSEQVLSFSLDSSGNGSASRLSKQGDTTIRVDAFDNLVHEPVTFIKMDIEGAEGEALAGCRNTILKHHPRLAIAVYHRHDDFRMIPDQVLSIRDDYDVYLRHYTEGTTETVMFFVPRKGAA